MTEDMVMKTLRNYLVVSILLLSRTASADHNHNSTLLLHHQDYVPMIIETEFTFNNLTPGRHYLRIFGINGAYNMHGEPVFFKGYVDIPAASMVTIVLLNNRTLHYASVLPKPIYAPVSTCSTEPYYSEPVFLCPAGIDPRRYESIRASIAARSFDKTRLDLAKQAIRHNNMSSEQIAGLAELLTFDSSRLALAKFGYRYVADPENYHVLYELFAFDSSVRQLSDYIARMS
jgi:hypothetical protein